MGDQPAQEFPQVSCSVTLTQLCASTGTPHRHSGHILELIAALAAKKSLSRQACGILTDSDMIHIPAIELNVTEHCNLRCQDCDHASGIIPPRNMSITECSRDLSTLACVLHARELKIVGGEPLLHPRLARILHACRESGIADSVVLWTNGLLLGTLPPKAWREIDGIVVSIYPSVSYDTDFSALQPLVDKHGVWLHKRRCPEFMCGTTAQPIGNSALVQHIYDTCSEAHYFEGHTVRAGRYFKCVQAAYASTRLAAHGIAFDNAAEDGIRIVDSPDLEEYLRDYLRRRDPLMACRYCLGDIGRWHRHRQASGSQQLCELPTADMRSLVSDDVLLPTCYFENTTRAEE